MTTATTWDVLLGDDRPLTETEILRMRDVYIGDYLPEASTEERVDGLTNAIKEAFKTLVNHYIEIRGRIDPAFHSVPEVSDGDDDDDDRADFDFYGDTITIEWKEWDRCGDRDYYVRSFPLAHLWAPDWESVIKDEVEVHEQAKKAKQEAERTAMAAAREARERAQLADLLGKYGVPPGYKANHD